MTSVLIDTSVWIEFFRPNGDASYRNAVCELIDDNKSALCGMILSELLKGARSEKEYKELEERLSTLLYLGTPESTWNKAGRIASHLLRKGIQVPMTDLVIAVIAIENKSPLFHKDKHFSLLEKHTDLKVFEISS